MAGITGGLQEGRSIWGRRGIGVLMEKGNWCLDGEGDAVLSKPLEVFRWDAEEMVMCPDSLTCA